MKEEFVLEYDAFLRSFKRNIDVPHSFLLGAGASISSGIQSASDCIWEWKKDIFLSQNVNASEYFKNYKEEPVRKSIQKWLDAQGKFPLLGSDEEYCFYAEKAYPIGDDRRKYFLGLIHGHEPYIGYKLLCLLGEHGIVRAVWTTNFDGLAARAAYQNKLTPIEITLDNTDAIYRKQSSKELLTIALHGDYKFNSLKNTAKELDSQNSDFSTHLSNYHSDKNLIILGYSGRDRSLMEALEHAFTKKGAGRLYWCGYGDQISECVTNLLVKIRESGREAYYVPTDGFDKTLIHLCKTAFEGNSQLSQEIQDALEQSENVEYVNSEFTMDFQKTGKFIKSNLHPIIFPKEVFQFEIDFSDEKPWTFIKELTAHTDVCAVPFKKMVFALGTLSEIALLFKGRLKSEIRRETITKSDIEKVSAFKALMLQAVLKTFAKATGISSNLKNKLWLHAPDSTIGAVSVHKAVHVSLFFDKNKAFSYLTFSPGMHLLSNEEIPRLQRQTIGKKYLEKLFNNRYDEVLDFWTQKLFNNGRLKFDYPANSGSGFEFQISNHTAVAEIDVLDPNFRGYLPSHYDRKLTQFKGLQYLEPQLVFRSSINNSEVKDYHPMRGLVNNRPYDVNLNGVIHSNEVSLTVVCKNQYAGPLYNFLSQLQAKHSTENVNPDYLIDYPGFTSIFNIPINIPLPENADRWYDVNFNPENALQTHENALRLARLITSQIEKISNTVGQSTIVVFIPDEWQPFESYENSGEHFDLHDYIKAFSASQGISTQLIREDTLRDNLKCQIYWWLSLSFYVKSLRTPWILNNQERNTAYAGIGYSVNRTSNKTEIVIGCSHIYDSNGQGLKYKLSKIDDYYLDKKSNPFLSYKDAYQFGVSIRELFYQSLDKLPDRVVIHKRTRFTEDEVNGIKDSLHKAGIKNIDLIEIAFEPDARFVALNVYQQQLQIDKFPLSRGTCIVTDKFSALLWTHGIVPSVRQPNYKFYLGGRSIPAPIKIIKHYGESNISSIATEILGLTKMNWNSLDLYSKLPSTIDSSNHIAKIGKLLSRFEGKTYDYRLFI